MVVVVLYKSNTYSLKCRGNHLFGVNSPAKIKKEDAYCIYAMIELLNISTSRDKKRIIINTGAGTPPQNKKKPVKRTKKPVQPQIKKTPPFED